MKTEITANRLLRSMAIVAVVAGAGFASSTIAATFHVPADFATIQAAVDAAAPAGDEIRIAPGVYTQQVFISQKKLTLTGSGGTVLEAWTGMKQIEGKPVYALVWITADADVVMRNIEFDGKRLAASMPNSSLCLEAVHFWGASGRVDNCRFRSFRGLNNLGTPIVSPLGGRGFGLLTFNPIGGSPGVVHVQVINCHFSDNAQSMTFAGDYGPGNFDPRLLRTTFVVEGNTVAGISSANDYQWGVVVLGGASGIIKSNHILDHSRQNIGYWCEGIYARPERPAGMPMVTLQPLRIESNSFIGNQKHLVLRLGDHSQVINNVFDGTGSTLPSDGVWITGSNVLVAINLFTHLDTGVYLAANNPKIGGGAESSVAVNPSLQANQFCDVGIPVSFDPGVVNPYELGSAYCPWAPAGFGDLACSPAAGLPGTTVTLSGTNLTGATTVLFNGLSAEFTPGEDPDKELVATVPAHATTGPVTIITPSSNITSLTPFTVPVPLAMSLQPGGLVHLSWCADACDRLLESASSLAAPDWQAEPTSPSVGTTSVTWKGRVRSGAQFFRLRQPAGPGN